MKYLRAIGWAAFLFAALGAWLSFWGVAWMGGYLVGFSVAIICERGARRKWDPLSAPILDEAEARTREGR